VLRHRGLLKVPAKLHILSSVFRLGQSPVSVFLLSCCNSSSSVTFMPIGYRLRLHFCLCLHGFAIVFPILHQIPVVIRSPDLWLPFGFSVLLSRLPSPLFVMFSRFILFSGATWFSLRITVIPISAFLSSLSISGVLAAQPASFVPSLGPFCRRSTLRSIPSPRLISDFLCSSQLLPIFSLYSLLMARLWRFGFLFCSSVSSLSRAYVLRPPSSSSPITLLPCVVVLLIGVSFLRGLSFSDLRFLFRPVVLFVVLCFTFYVLLLLLFMLDFYGVCLCWIMDFGMFVFGVTSMAADRDSPQPTSILAALSSSPRVVSVVVFSFVLSHRCLRHLFVFSIVPLCRLPLGVSTLASVFALQPLVLRPSFSSLSRVESRP
jgi:hypothetical protein